MKFDDEGLRVLRWVPDEDAWVKVLMNDWLAFLGIDTAPKGLRGLQAGIQYFVVCIDDNGVPVNIIPHKYLVEPGGRMGPDNFAGLTKEERADYWRLLSKPHATPADEQRLQYIREKTDVSWPPAESICADSSVRHLPTKGQWSLGFSGRTSPAAILTANLTVHVAADVSLLCSKMSDKKPGRPPAATIAKHMKRAREIARGALCLGWRDVLRDLHKENPDAAFALHLWAAVAKRDEIDLICRSAREERRFK